MLSSANSEGFSPRIPGVPPDRRYAVIIPACNEEACIRQTISELHERLERLDSVRFITVVGVNGSSDATAEIARECGAIVAETSQRGYGYGCQAAIEAVESRGVAMDGYIFFAADGASDPCDLAALVAKHEAGFGLVLGCRTTLHSNRQSMSAEQILANRILGEWCGVLTLGRGGCFFADLGPLRLIDRDLFHAMWLREWTYGWTIEAQIRAVLLRAQICEVPVRERRRTAGEQKISGVSLRRTLVIGAQIFLAGWRARWRR